MIRIQRWLPALMVTLLLWVGCATPIEPPPPRGISVLNIFPQVVDHLVVPGGSLLIDTDGAALLDPRLVTVRFDGFFSGIQIQRTLTASHTLDNQTIRVEVPWSELELVVGASTDASFKGNLIVHVDDVTGEVAGEGTLREVDIQFVSTLQPEFTLPGQDFIHLNEERVYPGQGVLRTGEGTTELVLTGTYVADNGGTRRIESSVPMKIAQNRQEATLRWPPSLFGLRPGTFEGEAHIENRHALGAVSQGPTQELKVTLEETALTGFDPPIAGRGQRVQMIGKGFIPFDTGLAQSMFFNFEGTFLTTTGESIDFSGGNILRLAPDDVPDHSIATIGLRTEISEDPQGRRSLTGLTARPGVFTGTVTPVLVDGSSTVEGRGIETSFTISPTEQHVFVKFLPGFSDALAFYGLRNVEPEIRSKVFENIERDFAGLNISFSDQRPDIFVEYSVIEVGGEDPNGVGLLGLDNTAGKDTGNLRLDDVIGGSNADSSELGFYAFGGVFIKSFVLFSPSLTPENELSSSGFDVTFGSFMADLGGEPINADELVNTVRLFEVEEAVRAMGSLIANTISHEIGHSLGLSFFEEDLETDSQQFHNEFDTPNAMMDAGRARPFEERAEIQGQGPAVFNQRNRAYLEEILPLP